MLIVQLCFLMRVTKDKTVYSMKLTMYFLHVCEYERGGETFSMQ